MMEARITASLSDHPGSEARVTCSVPEILLELIDHHPDHLFGVHLFIQMVGFGEEVAFECWHPEPGGDRREAKGGEQSRRGGLLKELLFSHDLLIVHDLGDLVRAYSPREIVTRWRFTCP